MRKVMVPVDMQSEQKELLGIISKRQLIYLIVGGIILYWYLPFVFSLFGTNWIVAVIAAIVSALPTLTVTLLLAFYRIEKYHMYIDRLILTKLQYKSQLGNWRKGTQNIIDTEEL
ncbi:PrgI family mobile element protein [Rossellomorea arthrocnemi]|uniref:PrgI family mobile element protein n=1 Tax=Rossellomorea arthrocnemi TaxID=2769542 RepID=UPI001918154C|nr:PrgI family protein [Rossellomorea arthrocnemi]